MESKVVVAILLAVLLLITPTPVIDSIGPNVGLNNEIVEVVIEGSKFRDKAEVKLVKPGEADLVATDVKVISKKQISCSFDLRGQAVGKWDVTVENPTKVGKKEKTVTLGDGFTIEYPVPTITTVEPFTGLNTEILTLNVAGTNFREGAMIDLVAPDLQIIASDVKVISSSQLSAVFDLRDSILGSFDLRVTNDDGKAAVLFEGFTIAERQLVKPTIRRIIPNEGYNNCIVRAEIFGENLDPGVSVKLIGTLGDEIPGYDIVLKNSREISCRFDLYQEPVGKYDVVVFNPDGQESILKSGFMVKGPSGLGSKVTLKPVFFDFDKSEIRPDQLATVADNLVSIIENPDWYILLGGHADERGTREYNFGLSERRADTIKGYLLEKGVDPSRITVYGYGEDYPSMKGHDEQSWSYNRRVDFIVGDAPLSKVEGIIE